MEEDARLGEKISQMRIRSRLTQAELADKAGVGKSTIARVEKGLPIQTTSLFKIARVLPLTGEIETLLSYEKESPAVRFHSKKGQPKRVRKPKDRPSGNQKAVLWRWGDEK